ncbi:D-glycero-alpha-D-manno-heptose-1,7-bisphosphate 7-phosphatase [Rossellomorea aquimaris]|uniref:D,D-heptose 1,7-bisphosphate phosphatase n=1 Tax=Rossellomorea aquimaris TaxID=189382 RepID=A0A5D4U6V8_9BACI|nr:HAD-IIIA family hydrolase [Rossellomorea aquimaris]TYS82841.1 HAD-IIIA family hydrolase [Rossellomorea aquimaris]
MRAVFLDRDGTIGGTGGGMHPDEFTLYDFSPQSIRTLNQSGLKVLLFTNQTRVGRGYFSEKQLLMGFNRMKAELKSHSAFLDDIFYCPHKPDDNCFCQKPRIGLLLEAQRKYNLQLEQCYVVGDTGSADMIAAETAGAKKVLVKTGWGINSLTSHRYTWKGIDPHYIAEDLMDAVNWIVNDCQKDRKEAPNDEL